jgi:hypothetical protein
MFAGRWGWTDGNISGHVLGDLSALAFVVFPILCEGKKRCRERKSNRKQWIALHLEDRINE